MLFGSSFRYKFLSRSNRIEYWKKPDVLSGSFIKGIVFNFCQIEWIKETLKQDFVAITNQVGNWKALFHGGDRFLVFACTGLPFFLSKIHLIFSGVEEKAVLLQHLLYYSRNSALF